MASIMNLLLSGEVSNVGVCRRMIFGGSCLLVASAAEHVVAANPTATPGSKYRAAERDREMP